MPRRGPRKSSSTPIKVEIGDHVFHRGTDRYLGEVTEVRSHTIRFDGPDHAGGSLATRYEIYKGDKPTTDKDKQKWFILE